jgi:membrane fusion protein (multidrug efflux system)
LEGRITAVNFASGGRVDKGDILLQLDISEESARLKAAAARANLARLDLERFTRLFASKTVSEEQVDQARAEFDMASASVNELQAIIAKKSLKAPFAAVAGLHQLEAGEFLQANTPIVMLVGINDHAWVDFNLAITQGTVDIGSEVGVVAPGGRGDGVPAVVIARNPAVSASSRNMRYRAKISANPLLPPNSVVNIRIPIGSEQQVQVPATAVLRDELGAYVFVLDAEANGAYRARRQSVTVGREEDQMVGVSGGLQVGSLVATDGAFKLRDNLLTHVRQRPGDRAGQRGE